MDKSNERLLIVGVLAIVAIVAIVVAIAVTSSAPREQHVCWDGTTIVSNLNDCPKRGLVEISGDCYGEGGSMFGIENPTSVAGEFTFSAKSAPIRNLKFTADLISSKTKKSVYSKTWDMDLNVGEQRTINFDYTLQDQADYFNYEMYTPVGMDSIYQVTCDDCDIQVRDVGVLSTYSQYPPKDEMGHEWADTALFGVLC